ncbi:hypothetical protein BD410DRAFT_735516 [Rickenella mellea]|uniref:Prolyl 4-hydroxylase alpha subunit Fe(2+) 2OG dioxygenase domain-containing protein n=1 Tax=Rickenella mellea TaxID=50990 RepID=A0A4Y7PDI5_9AGAM|nr:hypothetical protein BD410DRAFT_735516 [Rickenella mellea]
MHIDPSLWQGRSVIFNRQTPDHVDRRDDPKEFTPIFVLGRFGGGYIRLKTLRLRMWFGGGACVFIRGGLFPHGIEPFHGSQRVSIAHFAHRSLFRQLDVKLSSLGLN